MSLSETSKPTYSLLELTTHVREAMSYAFPETYWVKAETSDVRVNVSSGHCYLEFVEKDSRTNMTVAKVRGSIWANTFRILKPYFEETTKQPFSSGIKVLVCVTVEFHQVYGFSLNVVDIDPTYTIGDMQRRRLEIIKQLKDEGIYTLNKELPLPSLPQRIAIITSPTAAGYEDFLDHLMKNSAGYFFYPKLFPAMMQGDRTESSVIAALDEIDLHRDLFDVVVIIRGGGATSDLNSFDSYLLAANCAQYPLPIITGIGHERDDTIVDLVAHTKLKTPTAVAAFLVDCMDRAAMVVNNLQQSLLEETRKSLQDKRNYLTLLATRFPATVMNRIERNRSWLQLISGKLPVIIDNLQTRRKNVLGQQYQRMRTAIAAKMIKEQRSLELAEQFVRIASPDYILKRGYTLTLRDGKIIKSSQKLKQGDKIISRFADGEVQSAVESAGCSQ